MSKIKSRNTRNILQIVIKWGMSILGFIMVIGSLGVSPLNGLYVLRGFHFIYF